MYSPNRRRIVRLFTGVIPVAFALLAGCATIGPMPLVVPPGATCPQQPLPDGIPGDPRSINPLHPTTFSSPSLRGGPLVATVGSLGLATWADQGGSVATPVYCQGEQEPPSPIVEPPQDSSDIVTTGTRIAHPDLTTASPVTVLSSQEIKRLRATAAAPALAAPGAEGHSLAAVRGWFALANGTLSDVGFAALASACQASWNGLTADCAAAVKSGIGAFATVPADARNEFAFLFQQNCPADQAPELCLQKMESNRLFRSLARAKLEPQPTTMNEGVRSRFTARLNDSGSIHGLSSVATNEGVEGDATRPGQLRLRTLIPYSNYMCFRLKSEDPDKAKIEPVAEPGAVIKNGKLCMNVNVTGATKYEPSWWVTPLAGKDLSLLLDADYDVQGDTQVFHFQPRPIIIQVVPKPGRWDRIDELLQRAASTANLATGLAKAIGALIAATAAWGIWGWFKRKQSAAPDTGRKKIRAPRTGRDAP